MIISVGFPDRGVPAGFVSIPGSLSLAEGCSWAKHREVELEKPGSGLSTARGAEYLDNGTPLIFRMRQDGTSAVAEKQSSTAKR